MKIITIMVKCVFTKYDQNMINHVLFFHSSCSYCVSQVENNNEVDHNNDNNVSNNATCLWASPTGHMTCFVLFSAAGCSMKADLKACVIVHHLSSQL
jgi:hypothetical protein